MKKYRRTPCELTADRLKHHYEFYYWSFSGSERQTLSDAIYVLERMSETVEAVDRDE